jgi:CHRD domain
VIDPTVESRRRTVTPFTNGAFVLCHKSATEHRLITLNERNALMIDFRNAPRLCFIALPALLWLASAATADDYIALLNSGQEVPDNVSNALGVFTATYDKSTNLLHFELTFSGLEGDQTAAHLHGPAEKGKTAPVLFGIVNPGEYGLGSPKVGFLGPFSEEERDMLDRGLMYVNVHSRLAPGGEIRGQIHRVQRR